MSRDHCYRPERADSGLIDRLTRRLESSWRDGRPHPALRPLGAAYGLGAALRRKLYGPVFKAARAEKPVVSIGNLTVGGSGKTPMALALARLLLEAGYSPAVLSRGYGRRPAGEFPPPVAVSRGAGPEVPPEAAGDEPWLMAAELPELRVVVDADRARGAQKAVRELGADILILDDGFQHLKLAADCRVLMVPAYKPFGNRAVLPAGPLREPVRAHRRADILVAAGAPDPPPELLALAEGRPVFAAEYRPLGWQALGRGFALKERRPSNPAETPGPRHGLDEIAPLRGIEPLEALAGRPVFAFCGLGRPDSFFRSLTALGLNLRRFTALRDHQVYDRPTLNQLGLDFTASGAEVLVTTAKDAVKIPAGFPWPVLALKMDLALDRPGEFLDAVLKGISKNGRL